MPETKIKKVCLSKGVTLHYIKDDKYKTNYLSIYFSLPLTSENSTRMNLLAKVLKRGSEGYPTMAELNSALDMNYSSAITLSATKEGERETFLLSVATMKNEYAPHGEDVFGEAVKIALDVLLKPYIEKGEFKKEYFDSEKRNLRDSILSQINNKSTYSRTRFVKAMCEGEPYSVNGEGDIDVLEGLESGALYEFLNYMLKSAVCNVYFVGSEREERVVSLLSDSLGRVERGEVVSLPSSVMKTPSERKEVVETLDVTQAHLLVGFRTPATYSHPDYLKFVLLNMVLGGDVSSKMFMNIRERLSLCYTCYSSLDGTKGILYAYAGIDPDKKDETLSAFYKELDNVREGNITEAELADAKKAYINRMKEIEDNPSLLPTWFHMRLGAEARDPALDAERIAEITLDDVVSAAKEITEDTVYFLTKNN